MIGQPEIYVMSLDKRNQLYFTNLNYYSFTTLYLWTSVHHSVRNGMEVDEFLGCYPRYNQLKVLCIFSLCIWTSSKEFVRWLIGYATNDMYVYVIFRDCIHGYDLWNCSIFERKFYVRIQTVLLLLYRIALVLYLQRWLWLLELFIKLINFHSNKKCIVV